MVSVKTKKLFKKQIMISEEFTVNTLMRKLNISRPTATNLISNLLNYRVYSKRKIIIPISKIGDKQKWYLRKY